MKVTTEHINTQALTYARAPTHILTHTLILNIKYEINLKAGKFIGLHTEQRESKQ